ncbi:phytase [Caulobacter sp. 17J65-9]|uniref:phytase n=1 Tax=Caulobacter sp. 17J65-9 TaxID=2709382 RepID=UPI0013CB81C0|nr:phytase [Caulobacter sp. 17J65-9]NEX93778.1 phytase [Caulobacter sp. 17J65-9]
MISRRILTGFATPLIISVLGASCASAPTRAPTAKVAPAMETVAVASVNADAADDPAIWAAPAGARARFAGREVDGFVLGTDKKAGLYAYALDGSVLQFLPDGLLNNVDLRADVMVDGRPQVLIGASDRGRMGVALYLFDPASTDPANAIRPWGLIKSDLGEPYGFCLGRRGDVVSAVLVGKDGQVRQYRITDDAGAPKGVEERRFAVGSQSEGCVVDDVAGKLYVGEEAKGVWTYGFDPAAGNAREQLAPMDKSLLVADVEGTTLMRDGAASYVIVSSQGDSAFAVWRVDGPAPAYAGRFEVVAANGVDAISGTDGLDAWSGPIGAYPEGLLVIQDDENEGRAQNFKFVDWREVKRALRL